MSSPRTFCTFHLAGLYFGVEVQKVQEVIRYQKMTRIPLAHSMFRGLINLRGQIVSAIDLRCKLQMPPLSEGRLPMNVVIRTDADPFSLLVDEIGEVLEVNEEDFEEPPKTLKGVVRELICGAYQLENRLLLVLDCDSAIHATVCT